MNIKQQKELEKLRSKWNLECATAQKNKVAYVLKRSKDNYLRVMGSENGLLQYQAQVLELTAGVGNQKEVAIIERERLINIVDDVFGHVPEDTVLGVFGVEIQDKILGALANAKPGRKTRQIKKPATAIKKGIDSKYFCELNVDNADALELSGPYRYRGCSVLGSRTASAVVAGIFALSLTLSGGLSAGPAMAYVEPIVGQTLVVPSSADEPRAHRSFGIYIPQMIYPFDPAVISDGWGNRSKACASCSTFHEGVDFNPGYGSEVPNIISGTVVEAEYSGSLGVHVYVDDGYGMIVMYGHMIEGSLRVNVGDHVELGQIIGQVGSTGTSTGPHLHLAIQLDGSVINPIPVLDFNPVRPGLY